MLLWTAPRQRDRCELSEGHSVLPESSLYCIGILRECLHPVFTLWHQPAIRLKKPVEQICTNAAESRVTPAANETSADLGLCRCVD